MQEMPNSVDYAYYPSYIHLALEMMPDLYSPEDVDRLEEQWGELDEQTLLAALPVCEGVDRVFVLVAVGTCCYTANPALKEVLLPFLESQVPMERWAAALCLGKLQEAQALPHLLTMLTEFLPPQEQYMAAPRQHLVVTQYDLWRTYIPGLLATWHVSSLLPSLRQALLTLLSVQTAGPQSLRVAQNLFPTEYAFTEFQARVSQKNRVRDIPPQTVQVFHNYEALQRYWKETVESLVYVLGQKEAWGVLTGISYKDKQYLDALYVQLIMGYLSPHYPRITAMEWDEMPAIQVQVKHYLQCTFGLDKEEQEACIQSYEQKILPSPF
jgi:hypothetical protein